jgi:hypothetical protein
MVWADNCAAISEGLYRNARGGFEGSLGFGSGNTGARVMDWCL